MDKSDIQETLVHLYLRLNGYFVGGYIAHASKGVGTELDVLAVRFPRYEEREREVLCCTHLAIPTDRLDFIVGEVKGGKKNVNFNQRFRNEPRAVRSVLNRIGAFPCAEISRVCAAVQNLLDPANIRTAGAFPELDLALWHDTNAQLAKLRFVPFAAEQNRVSNPKRPYIFQDDMLAFIWECFRPNQQRPMCGVRYNFDLWGPQFVRMVEHFKDLNRTSHGTINDLYVAYGVT
ncbi:MAG: hypothetical protein KBD94_09570 [Pyrinomonadaceae bacterium]|nr:hypothetical protein [Pyrinomonadaceae bacterium]